MNQPQPAPVITDSPAVWPLVIADIEKLGAGPGRDWMLVSARERNEIGIERYGTPLLVENGRDQYVDGLQELADCCVYWKAAETKETEPGRRARLSDLYWSALLLWWRAMSMWAQEAR